MKKQISIAASLIAALAFVYFAIGVVNRPPSLTSTFNRIYAEATLVAHGQIEVREPC